MKTKSKSKNVIQSHLMCVVYHVIAKCKCQVRVFIDSIHWFDSEAEAEAEANAKGRGRGKGSRDFLNTF